MQSTRNNYKRTVSGSEQICGFPEINVNQLLVMKQGDFCLQLAGPLTLFPFNTSNALLQDLKRANLQSGLCWTLWLKSNPNLPNPTDWDGFLKKLSGNPCGWHSWMYQKHAKWCSCKKTCVVRWKFLFKMYLTVFLYFKWWM